MPWTTLNQRPERALQASNRPRVHGFHVGDFTMASAWDSESPLNASNTAACAAAAKRKAVFMPEFKGLEPLSRYSHRPPAMRVLHGENER
jgi:hypothetical protein